MIAQLIAIETGSRIGVQQIANSTKVIIAELKVKYAISTNLSSLAVTVAIIFITLFFVLFPLLDLLHYFRLRKSMKKKDLQNNIQLVPQTLVATKVEHQTVSIKQKKFKKKIMRPNRWHY